MGALGALAICISLETEKVITELLQALPDFVSSLVPQVRDQGSGMDLRRYLRQLQHFSGLFGTQEWDSVTSKHPECKSDQEHQQISQRNILVLVLLKQELSGWGSDGKWPSCFSRTWLCWVAGICGFMSFHPHRAEKDHSHASCSFKLAEVGEGNAGFHSSWHYQRENVGIGLLKP